MQFNQIGKNEEAMRNKGEIRTGTMMKKTGITDIPEEILVSKIFMKTPASCITDTIQSVCRRWRQLTTDNPYFVRAHVDAHRPTEEEEMSSIVFQHYRFHYWYTDGERGDDGFLHLGKLDVHRNTVSDLKIRSPLPAGSGLPVEYPRASCDGLLCFQFYPRIITDSYAPRTYYICNPLLGTWTCIPPPPPTVQGGRCSVSLCGFYYHFTTGEYRLLQYSFRYGNRTSVYEVCSAVGADNNSWRSIMEFPPLASIVGHVDRTLKACNFLYKNCIHVNQRLHWLVNDFVTHQVRIVQFDTESDKFTTILGPVVTSLCKGSRHELHKMGGNLCVGHILQDRGGKIMQLWMMKQNDYQWVRLHTICSDGQGFAVTRRLVPKPVHEVDGELLVTWDLGSSYSLYNFKLKTSKTMPLKRFNDSHAFDLRYKESLLDPRQTFLVKD